MVILTTKHILKWVVNLSWFIHCRWYVRWNNNTERFEYKPYKEYLVNPTTGSGSNTVGSQSYNGDGQNVTAQRIVAMAVNSMTGDMHGDGVWNAALNDSR